MSKLGSIVKRSIGRTLRIEEVRRVGGREKQKVVVRRVRGGQAIRDFIEGPHLPAETQKLWLR